MRKALLSLACGLLTSGVAPIAVAQPIKIVAAGDSITSGYTAGFPGGNKRLDRIMGGGVTVGWQTDNWDVGYTLISGVVARQFIDAGGIGQTLAQDPDVIVLMLGTNDAARSSWNGPGWLTAYQTAMTEILDAFAGYTNERGRAPKVVLLNLIEFTPLFGNYSWANPAIVSGINPWLEELAGDRGLIFGNVHDHLMSQPNWQSFYNDGVHLWNGTDQPGYNAIANYVSDTIKGIDFNAPTAIPEPACMSLLSLSVVMLRRRKRVA